MMITPPSEIAPDMLSTASNLLMAQAEALKVVAEEYSDGQGKETLLSALMYMYNTIMSSGKIVLTGMGKSYKVAAKLTATLSSLGITAVPLHAADAFHGDIGIVKSRDVVIFISTSGKTPELLAMMSHLPRGITKVTLTSEPKSPLALASDVVLNVPIPDCCLEKNIYGLAAPTVSTTAAQAVGDAICISLFEMLETNEKDRQVKFGKWHPGGAIGQSYAADAGLKTPPI